MFTFRTFSISGDNRTTLEAVLRFLMETQGFRPVKTGYGTLTAWENGQVLLIGERLDDSVRQQMGYPFQMTPETLAEQIDQFVQSFTETDLARYGIEEEEFDCAEEYTIGWELFRPDWYSKEHGIREYTLFDLIAVKPVLITYGK